MKWCKIVNGRACLPTVFFNVFLKLSVHRYFSQALWWGLMGLVVQKSRELETKKCRKCDHELYPWVTIYLKLTVVDVTNFIPVFFLGKHKNLFCQSLWYHFKSMQAQALGRHMCRIMQRRKQFLRLNKENIILMLWAISRASYSGRIEQKMLDKNVKKLTNIHRGSHETDMFCRISLLIEVPTTILKFKIFPLCMKIN